MAVFEERIVHHSRGSECQESNMTSKIKACEIEKKVDSIVDLQDEWKVMFQETLPQAAILKSPAQSRWPVYKDHCFARIILDNVVGKDMPWGEKLKSPAYKNMSSPELTECINLGKGILSGEEDLVKLDNNSLVLRGKEKGLNKKLKNEGIVTVGALQDSDALKRKRDEHIVVSATKETETEVLSSPYFTKKVKREEIPSAALDHNAISNSQLPDTAMLLAKIKSCSKTPFQKSVLTALMQVPRGSHTTYGAMAKHLNSSARAVGNALKNNPFAPEVPCHRVLASGGGLGGFHGSWGRNGEPGANDTKKIKLLRDEGVKFDGRGRVVGSVWETFT